MRTGPLCQRGFTLVEMMIVVGIVGLLASMAVPYFARARSLSYKSTCMSNLRQLHGAKITWAVERNKAATEIPTDADLFGILLYIREKPQCPGGGTYNLQPVDTKPTCSIPGHSL